MANVLLNYQTLIAGLLAIVAGALAFVGAKAQAAATRETSEKQHREEQRATAAAIWAELSWCANQIAGEALVLRDLAKTDYRMFGFDYSAKLPDTSIFDSNPSVVGRLPATEAYAVVSAYKQIAVVARDLRNAETYRQKVNVRVPDVSQLSRFARFSAGTALDAAHMLIPIAGFGGDETAALQSQIGASLANWDKHI